MKKITLIGMLLVIIPIASFAGSGKLDGSWIWKFDYKLNGKLDGRIGEVNPTFTTGHYQIIGKYDTTSLVGEIHFAKTHNVITFFQFTDGVCYAAHSGLMVS